jgi:hypothetical protein
MFVMDKKGSKVAYLLKKGGSVKVGWRVFYWNGAPIEDSVPDHEYFDCKPRALEFARRMKKLNRFGYIAKVEIRKDDNGDDEWVEVDNNV